MITVLESRRFGIDEVRPHPENRRRGDVDRLAESIRVHGQYRGIVVNRRTGHILAGNHTYQAARAAGLAEVQADVIDVDEEEERRILLVDNRSSDGSTYDLEGLVADLQRMQASEGGLVGTGYDDAALGSLLDSLAAGGHGGTGDEAAGPGAPVGPTLADRFGVPPFSVLDARSGPWQDRKREWLALGCIAPKVGSLGGDANFEERTELVEERATPVEPGGALFVELRAHLRERLKASGLTQAKVNEAMGVVGMAGHWFGKSQPEVPTPDQWKKLKPLLGLDDRYDDVAMRTVLRPPAPGIAYAGAKIDGEAAASYKSQLRLAALQRTGSSKINGSSPATRGKGGMSEQLGPRKRGGPRPGSNGATATERAWKDGAYDGGDAWRGTREEETAATIGTSIFDPVLCELMLRWFCPKGGRVLDPFAGGTSLGVVAARLGYEFVGVDVRKDQVEANRGTVVGKPFPGPAPCWLDGDSAAIKKTLKANKKSLAFDFVCTDPPYFSLERYSGDERDGTTIKRYDDFRTWYAGILKAVAEVLAPDRFMCVKIGEARDKAGAYVNLVGDTARALMEAGLSYYNELILVTAVGSLPVRTARAFEASRKCGRTHQTVLVFCKGDPKRATQACGKVDLTWPEGEAPPPETAGQA